MIYRRYLDLGGVNALVQDLKEKDFRTDADEPSDSSNDRSFTIPWQKPPAKRARQILLPHGSSRRDVCPERTERRARLVNAIARGRRWLDEMISGSITDVEQIAARDRCSVRQVNMTISLAFLAPRTRGC